MSYVPTVRGAHASVAAIHDHPTLAFLQRFHYWASAVTIVVASIAVYSGLWHASFKEVGRTRFICTVLTLGLAVAFQITGNLLPMDQHGVQTVAIEAGIVSRVPGFGPDLARMMLGGNGVSEQTLALWYGIHRFALPAAFILVAIIATPSYLKKDDHEPRWGYAVLAVLCPFLIAFLMPSPLGTPAGSSDFSGFNALASWYIAPMHGMLLMFDRWLPNGGWIGAIIVPLVLFALVIGFAAGNVSERPSRMLAGAIMVLFAFATFGNGTSVAPLIGKRDPRVSGKVLVQSDTQDRVLATRGRNLFNQSCAGCHGSDGIGGTSGPSLVTLHLRQPKAEYTMQYIRNPKSIKPGSTMPPFPNFREEELRAMAEFLRFPKAAR